MPVTKIKLENFTAFKNLEVEFSPGINALVGANGTGKTHLMKACYAACLAFEPSDLYPFLGKLLDVFLPSGRIGSRLVRQGHDGHSGLVEVESGERRVSAFPTRQGNSYSELSMGEWSLDVEAVYVPAKEMLANAPGFLSLHALREVHFEEVYRDILLKSYLPPLRQPVDDAHQQMLDSLENVIGGRVIVKGEEFFRTNEEGDLSSSPCWPRGGASWGCCGC